MIAIGGLALIAAAVITRKLFHAKQDSKADQKQLHRIPQEEQRSPTVDQESAKEDNRMNELLACEGLKAVRLTENKYCLHPEYLIELLNFIGVMTQTLDKQVWDGLKDKRRQQFRNEDWDGYKQTVTEEFELGNRQYEKVTAEVLAALDL